MSRSKKSRPAKPVLPAQLRRDAALRNATKPSFNRPAMRKAPPTRRSGGHRG